MLKYVDLGSGPYCVINSDAAISTLIDDTLNNLVERKQSYVIKRCENI